jgi:hypothetical protein
VACGQVGDSSGYKTHKKMNKTTGTPPTNLFIMVPKEQCRLCCGIASAATKGLCPYDAVLALAIFIGRQAQHPVHLQQVGLPDEYASPQQRE